MHRFLLPALLTLALVGTAPPAAADGHGKGDDRYQDKVHEHAGEMKDKSGEHRDKAHEHTGDMKDKSSKHRDKAHEHTGEMKDKSGKHGEKARHQLDEHADKAKGELMRERRDERKAIKDAYDQDIEAGADRVKGKKPWWKFWGD